MEIILCTGMMRSASTWSFNVCRLLGDLFACRLNLPFGSSYLNGKELDNFIRERMKSEPGVVVVKIHTPGKLALECVQKNIIKNICTIRDPRDCVASRQLFEKEPFEQSVRLIKNNLVYVSFFQGCEHTLFIRYEEMMRNGSVQIKRICNYLQIEIDDNQLHDVDTRTNIASMKRVADSLKTKQPETLLRDRSHFVDPVTHIHENHVHGGTCGRWKTEMTSDQVTFLTRELKPWLISLGYETEASIKNMLSQTGTKHLPISQA
jgi:hypothetical protein